MNYFRGDPIQIKKTKTTIQHSTFQTTTHLTPSNKYKLKQAKSRKVKSKDKTPIRIRQTNRGEFRSNSRPNFQLS